MNKSEIIEQLEKSAKCFELCEVTTFKGYRTDKEGETHQITIEVFDSGKENSLRYFIYATTADGKTATGNPEGSLEHAISLVHWQDLDS